LGKLEGNNFDRAKDSGKSTAGARNFIEKSRSEGIKSNAFLPSKDRSADVGLINNERKETEDQTGGSIDPDVSPFPYRPKDHPGSPLEGKEGRGPLEKRNRSTPNKKRKNGPQGRVRKAGLSPYMGKNLPVTQLEKPTAGIDKKNNERRKPSAMLSRKEDSVKKNRGDILMAVTSRGKASVFKERAAKRRPARKGSLWRNTEIRKKEFGRSGRYWGGFPSH